MTEGGAPATIDVYHWNPVRPRYRGPIGRRLPYRRPVNNFGDLLGPLVVAGVREREGIVGSAPRRSAQLLSIGSIIHFALPGAVVWGSGVNGKVPPDAHDHLRDLDIRAVRGPGTREFLTARGFAVPEVYGDPALLLPIIRPDLVGLPKRHDVTIVPNLNDLRHHRARHVLDPRRPLEECLATIAASRLVVGSSLHGIVVAEALGVPARLVQSSNESLFKYEDYFHGTGRAEVRAAASVQEAIRMDGETPPEWDPGPLLEAFPRDLWEPRPR